MKENYQFFTTIVMTLTPVIYLLITVLLICIKTSLKRRRMYVEILENSYRYHEEFCENRKLEDDPIKILKYGNHCNLVLETKDALRPVLYKFSKLVTVSFIATLIIIFVAIFN